MNIFEVAEEFKISLKKLQRMDKRGILRLDGNATAADAMRLKLINGDALPVWMVVQLIEEPALVLELGKYAGEAQSLLNTLGKPKQEAAPVEVAAAIPDAAKNDPGQVAILIAWLKETIPARPVGHAYLASRILLGIAPAARKFEAPRIGRALLNCRNSPTMAGWHRTIAGPSQNSTVYQKGANLPLDL